MKSNKMLHTCKRNKDNEFYTLYEDVENEMSHYDFQRLKVFCPCDNLNSSFTKYFETNFHKLGLMELTINCLNPDKSGTIMKFNGDSWSYRRDFAEGGFESEEATKELENCDVVVTNPPFNLLAKKFIPWLGSSKKKFVLVLPILALSYKQTHIQFNDKGNFRLWNGFTKISKFNKPDGSIASFGTVCWIQNITENYPIHLDLQVQDMSSFSRYEYHNEIIYAKSNNDIPLGYDGIIAAPLKFIFTDKVKDYEILGKINNGADEPYVNFKCSKLLPDNKYPFARIAIRLKK